MKFPIGIQSFQNIRSDGYVYVDKTALIYNLINEGKYYFLSRPRRFGKSLLISTLDAYFSGRKDLFEGLAIEHLEKDWTKYPVLHLDLNSSKYTSAENLRGVFEDAISDWEAIYGRNQKKTELSLRFKGVIQRACEKTGRRVVILVDEYDKPLLHNIGDEELQDEIRIEMKAFFSQIKSQDQYIRFAFFTGVTKFSKVSIFSDLNNLMDITLDRRYDEICGITQREMEETFKPAIEALAQRFGVSYDEMVVKLQSLYDGYHFSDNLTGMYNPFSLLNAFAKEQLGYYWFETGTPTFLIDILRNNKVAIDKFDNMEMSASELGNIDNMLRNPKPLFFQSGYLTIKDYCQEDEMIYTLGFPNREVTDGFFNSLLPYYANMHDEGSVSTIRNLARALSNDDIDRFMLILQSFFADYDYSAIPTKELELHYHNVIFTVCKLLGLRVKAEYHTSNGRIDMLIETDKSAFIFEFKLNVGAKRALQQIEEKGYAAPFAVDSRKVYKIGVNFSTRIRGIKDWKVVEK